jgi:transposase
MSSITVGIDVSKDRLDVAVRPSRELFAVERNARGLEALTARLLELSPSIVALEATGGFETVVAATLGSAGLPVRLVAAGKPKMVAIIAVARKLLTILNAILRDGRPWQIA